MKKNRKTKIIACSIVLAILTGTFLFLLIPRNFPKTDLKNIGAIEVFDGNSGNTVTIKNKENIVYIVEELGNTNYRIEKPALGFGMTFRLAIKNENGEIVETLVVQSEDQIKKGLFFYETTTPSALKELFEHLYDLCDSDWQR